MSARRSVAGRGAGLKAVNKATKATATASNGNSVNDTKQNATSTNDRRRRAAAPRKRVAAGATGAHDDDDEDELSEDIEEDIVDDYVSDDDAEHVAKADKTTSVSVTLTTGAVTTTIATPTRAIAAAPTTITKSKAELVKASPIAAHDDDDNDDNDQEGDDDDVDGDKESDDDNNGTTQTKKKAIKADVEPADEDKKEPVPVDPQVVPRRGAFFLHDDRSGPSRGRGRGRGGRAGAGRGVWEDDGDSKPWGHDQFERLEREETTGTGRGGGRGGRGGRRGARATGGGGGGGARTPTVATDNDATPVTTPSSSVAAKRSNGTRGGRGATRAGGGRGGRAAAINGAANNTTTNTVDDQSYNEYGNGAASSYDGKRGDIPTPSLPSSGAIPWNDHHASTSSDYHNHSHHGGGHANDGYYASHEQSVPQYDHHQVDRYTGAPSRGWMPPGGMPARVAPAPSSSSASSTSTLSASSRAPVLGRSPAKMNPKAKEFIIGDAPDAATAAVITAAAGVPYPTAAPSTPLVSRTSSASSSATLIPRFDPQHHDVSPAGARTAGGYNMYNSPAADMRYGRQAYHHGVHNADDLHHVSSSNGLHQSHMQPNVGYGSPAAPIAYGNVYQSYDQQQHDDGTAAAAAAAEWGHQHAAPAAWDPQAAAAAWAAAAAAENEYVAAAQVQAQDDGYGAYYAAAGAAAARANNPYLQPPTWGASALAPILPGVGQANNGNGGMTAVPTHGDYRMAAQPSYQPTHMTTHTSIAAKRIPPKSTLSASGASFVPAGTASVPSSSSTTATGRPMRFSAMQ